MSTVDSESGYASGRSARNSPVGRGRKLRFDKNATVIPRQRSSSISAVRRKGRALQEKMKKMALELERQKRQNKQLKRDKQVLKRKIKKLEVTQKKKDEKFQNETRLRIKSNRENYDLLTKRLFKLERLSTYL